MPADRTVTEWQIVGYVPAVGRDLRIVGPYRSRDEALVDLQGARQYPSRANVRLQRREVTEWEDVDDARL